MLLCLGIVKIRDEAELTAKRPVSFHKAPQNNGKLGFIVFFNQLPADFDKIVQADKPFFDLKGDAFRFPRTAPDGLFFLFGKMEQRLFTDWLKTVR